MDVLSILPVFVLAISVDIPTCVPMCFSVQTVEDFMQNIAPEPSPQVKALIEKLYPGKKLTELTHSEVSELLHSAASELEDKTKSLDNVRNPVLIRCVIDWFEDQHGQGFSLSAEDQKLYDKKAVPALQRVFLRQKRWLHMLKACEPAPEVEQIKQGVANASVTPDKFCYAVGNIYEVIANTVIHGLSQGENIAPVAMLDKDLFKKTANILLGVAPIVLSVVEDSSEESTPTPS